MDHEFRSIVERLAILEGRIAAPAKKTVVSEPISALLKPQAVARVEEAVATEDVLDRVKKSFNDYLKSVADEVKQDSDIKEKSEIDRELGKKDTQDRDLVAKEKKVETEAVVQPSRPVKTVTNECGLWEVHGNEYHGFKIHRNGQATRSRFNTLDEAELALDMFAKRHALKQAAEQTADYIEEK